MRLILDTHVFLWWIDDSRLLSRRARAAIASPANECVLSLVSCWDIAIKQGLGKLKIPTPIERFVLEQLAANGFGLLGIDLNDVAGVAKLPNHHRDPFDRLLVAQALARSLPIVSHDPVFPKYRVQRVW